MLACRPEFSPDGRKVLFPIAANDERIAIGLHDRDAGTTRVLCELPVGGDHGIGVARWTDDGRTAVVLQAVKNRMHVAVVDVADQHVRREFDVPLSRAADHQVIPVPVLRGGAFFGGDSIQRLDLETGAIVTAAAPRAAECVLSESGGVVYSVSIVAEKPHQRIAVGILDPATLAVSDWFEQPADSPWSAMPMIAVSPDRHRVAFAAQWAVEGDQQEGQVAILVFADGKLESTVPLGRQERLRLGNIEWARDSTTMWAMVGRKSDDDAQMGYRVLQVDVAGNIVREIGLLDLPAAGKNDADAIVGFQVAIAPDGRALALSTAWVDHVPPEQVGLWLVDLAGKAPTPRRIPFPPKADAAPERGR